MKAAIHPKYVESTVTCACGNTFQTRSTKPTLRTDLCNVCHPFYTGEQRIVDTAGQVERFLKRAANAAAMESRPSKRQLRVSGALAKAEEEKKRAEEALKAEAAAAAEVRRAARAEADARRAAADAQAGLAGEEETEVAAEPAVEAAEA